MARRFNAGYHHEPLTELDAWNCINNAIGHLLSLGDSAKHFPPRGAAMILWEAQDALLEKRDINISKVFKKREFPSDGNGKHATLST